MGKAINVTSGKRYDPELHPSVVQDSQNSTSKIGVTFASSLQESGAWLSFSKKHIRENTLRSPAADNDIR